MINQSYDVQVAVSSSLPEIIWKEYADAHVFTKVNPPSTLNVTVTQSPIGLNGDSIDAAFGMAILNGYERLIVSPNEPGYENFTPTTINVSPQYGSNVRLEDNLSELWTGWVSNQINTIQREEERTSRRYRAMQGVAFCVSIGAMLGAGAFFAYNHFIYVPIPGAAKVLSILTAMAVSVVSLGYALTPGSQDHRARELLMYQLLLQSPMQIQEESLFIA